MLLCEVALGDVKEVGIVRQNTNDEEDEEQDEDDDNDFSKPLDLKKYQSRKAPGRQMPDPKHTITLKSGLLFYKKKYYLFLLLMHSSRSTNATWSISSKSSIDILWFTI